MTASEYASDLDYLACALRLTNKGMVEMMLNSQARCHHDLIRALRHLPGACGGMAHSYWRSACYRRGVQVFVENYRFNISVSTDPTASVKRGCQDSCCYGSPAPTLSNGRWVRIADTPEEVFCPASEIVREILTDALKWCKQEEAKKEKEEIVKEKEKEKEKQEFIDAWVRS